MAVPLSWGHIMKGHLATSSATSPLQRTPQTTWTHTWTWRTQKFIVASCSSPIHCSIPWVGQLPDFFPDLDPDYGKKKIKICPEFSWRPELSLKVMASCSAQTNLEPDSGHEWGHGQPWSSSRWSAGNLAFTSPALFGLLCFHLALPRTCFCPPKNMEQDLRGREGQRVAQERLSRGTKFACPPF